MMPKYIVHDGYKGRNTFLGYADTWEECKDIAKERSLETNGMCSVSACTYNNATKTYSATTERTVSSY